MKNWLLILLVLFLTGCGSKYENYAECAVKEEQKGASSITASNYCMGLVKKGEFDCGGSVICQILIK